MILGTESGLGLERIGAARFPEEGSVHLNLN